MSEEADSDTTELAPLPPRSSPTIKKITAFLAGELARQGMRQIVRIDLHEAKATGRPGGRGEPVHSWLIDEEPELFALGRVPALAAQIATYAEHDASSPGSHRYTIRTQNRIEVSARYAFVVEGPDVDTDAGDDPTVAGLASQQMRHNELLLQAALKTANAAVQTLADQLELANGRILKLEEERGKWIDEREALLSQQDERDRQTMAQVASDSRKDKLVDKISALLPAVANRIVGDRVLPGAQSPRDQMLGEIMGRLRSDDALRARLVSILPPDITILLVELMRSSAQPDAPQAGGAPVNGTATQGAS